MPRCATNNCTFFGLPENNHLCTGCAGIGTTKPWRHLTEDEALAAMGLTRDIFPTEAEVQERLLWIKKTTQVPRLFEDNYTSVERTREFLGLGLNRPLSVDMAHRLMKAASEAGIYQLALQKALVRDTFASWLLAPSPGYSVGLCYFGHFDDGPTHPRHVRNYVHLPRRLWEEITLCR